MARKTRTRKVGQKINVKPFDGCPATPAVIIGIIEHDGKPRTFEVVPDDDLESLIEVDDDGNVLL